MPGALTNAVVTADVVIRRVVDATRIQEAQLGVIIRQVAFGLDEAPFRTAGLADVVDHRAGCLAGQGGGGAATDRVDAIVGRARLGPVVVVAELHVTIEHGRQAIFLQLDEGCAAGGDRQTAHGEVAVAARARDVRLDTRQQAQHVAFRHRVEVTDDLGIDRRDRDRAVELGLGAGGGGHDDFGQRVASGRIGGRRIRRERGGGHRRSKSERRDRNARTQSGLAHSVPPFPNSGRLTSPRLALTSKLVYRVAQQSIAIPIVACRHLNLINHIYVLFVQHPPRPFGTLIIDIDCFI